MELLETQDPEKKKLIETSERHKRELEKEVHEMSDKTERALKNALIIGGTLAVTFLIVSSINRKKNKTKKSTNQEIAQQTATEVDTENPAISSPSIFSQIGERLTAQATALLLEMAKDKLAEYLSKRNQKDGNT